MLRARAFELAGAFTRSSFKAETQRRINRFGHQRDGNAQILRVDHGPFAGAFLAGGIENLVHERRAVRRL